MPALPQLPEVPTTPKPTAPPVDAERFLAGAPIGAPSCVAVLRNDAYTVGFCEDRRGPLWVGYRLTPAPNRGTKRPSRFKTDERTRAQVRHEDYTRSGYDRGHLAPSSAIDDVYGAEAQRSTFTTSNITPQRPTMNRRTWAELERHEVEFTQRWGHALVLVGTYFDQDRTRLASGVDVPDACWRVLAARDGRGNVVARAWLVPQDVTGSEPLDAFWVSVDRIEVLTGLDLLHDLPDDLEVRLEASE